MTDDTPTPPSESSTAAVAESPAEVSIAPNLPGLAPSARYTGRFAIVYAGLGLVLAAAVVGLIVLVIRPGYHSGPTWSAWKPASASTAKAVENEIANYLAPRYRLGENLGQLVSVVPTEPTVTAGTTAVSIVGVVVDKVPQSSTGQRVDYVTNNDMWNVSFCGLGANCSIDQGKATEERGRLVRREALEFALYTFKFNPSINKVAAFMPAPPGQTSAPLLYLTKDDLKTQLSEPLSKTLPLDTPPLPSSEDKAEAKTIDKLTLSHLYTYSFEQLQTGGAALLLDPAS